MQKVYQVSFVLFFVIFDSTLEVTAQSVDNWQQCLGSSYFISADTRNYYESKTYCHNMLRQSYLANFTLAHAKDIITSCTHLNLSNELYWLGQQEGQCRVFNKERSNAVVYLQPCTNIAHPLCETSRMPAIPVGLPSQMKVVDSSWQACNGKCYLFGAGNVTFSAVSSYCRSMSTHSQPATFGLKLEGSVTTELSTCRLNTGDGHTYWINKHSVQNRIDPDCRTVTFSGTAVHFKTTPCLSSSKPFCETSNTSFCKTSNKTDGIAKDWVSVSGQRPSYKVSSGTFGYCDGQNHCEVSLKAQIAREGNFTFMGLLAIELGIKGQQKLDFWLHSPGISCPSPQDNGSLMQYIGPQIHMVQRKNATEKYRVLCEENVTKTTTVPTVVPSTTSGRKLTSTTTLQTTRTPSTTTTQTTTQTSTASATHIQTTTQTRTPSKTSSQSTTQTSAPSTRTSQSTTQTSTPSTTSSQTTTQTSTASTTTSQTTTQTSTPSMTTSQTTTQTSTSSTSTSSTASPSATLSTNSTTSPLTFYPGIDATSIGHTWTTIGQEEYYVNYDRGSYIMAESYCREKLNASLVMFLSPIKYFTILSQIALKNSSFWVGAHSMDQTGLTDACLSYIVKNMTMTTLPCHFKKFSVCSRILGGDISKVLEDPGFRQMIREMTVLRNETKKSIRKLTCAEDRRTSARAAGGVGVFIVCAVVTLLLISDCSGIKSDFFNRKKKAQ